MYPPPSPRTARRGVSPFDDHVVGVREGCADEEVRRVHAWRVVARVKNELAMRNGAVRDGPRDTARNQPDPASISVHEELSVARSVSRAVPLPALAHEFVLGVESLHIGGSQGRDLDALYQRGIPRRGKLGALVERILPSRLPRFPRGEALLLGSSVTLILVATLTAVVRGPGPRVTRPASLVLHRDRDERVERQRSVALAACSFGRRWRPLVCSAFERLPDIVDAEANSLAMCLARKDALHFPAADFVIANAESLRELRSGDSGWSRHGKAGAMRVAPDRLPDGPVGDAVLFRDLLQREAMLSSLVS